MSQVQSLPIDPAQMRTARTLRLRPIQVNRYDRPLGEERTWYGDPALADTWRNMLLIRELETMLSSIKRER